jgi:hypothetical protein
MNSINKNTDMAYTVKKSTVILQQKVMATMLPSHCAVKLPGDVKVFCCKFYMKVL